MIEKAHRRSHLIASEIRDASRGDGGLTRRAPSLHVRVEAVVLVTHIRNRDAP